MEQKLQVIAHQHPLTFQGVTNRGWICNGTQLKAGCQSGDTNNLRWRCKQSNFCDFDLCQKCMDYYIAEEKKNPVALLKKQLSLGVSQTIAAKKTEPLIYGYALMRLT